MDGYQLKLGKLGFVHCAVVLECGGEIIEYYLGGGFTSGIGNKLPEKKRTPDKQRGNETTYAVDSPFEKCENEKRCLDNVIEKLTALPHHATGPNSNTFAHALLRVCCMTFATYEVKYDFVDVKAKDELGVCFDRKIGTGCPTLARYTATVPNGLAVQSASGATEKELRLVSALACRPS